MSPRGPGDPPPPLVALIERDLSPGSISVRRVELADDGPSPGDRARGSGGAWSSDTGADHRAPGGARTRADYRPSIARVSARPGSAFEALWDEALLGPLREFLSRPGKGFRGRLVHAGWTLAGGHPGALSPDLPLAIEVLHAGSLIVDDIQDQSETRRGRPALHHMVGAPLALNTGNWMYFWSLELMTRGLPDLVAATIQRRAVSALMRCHQGQALDLATAVTELPRDEIADVVAVSTGLKTGALMELAAALGAMAAGADLSRCDHLAHFGHDLGVGLQMLDDLGSLIAPSRRDKGLEDLSLARLTWPWAWLAEIARASEFDELRGRTRELSRRSARETATRDTSGSRRGNGDAGPRLSGEAASEANAIADRVAEIIAPVARQRVHRHLRNALTTLRHDLAIQDPMGEDARDPADRAPDHPGRAIAAAMAELQGEVERLEKSYG